MSPNEWGPPIWTLFHTLAEKIKEEHFQKITPELFFFIKRICSSLPCPECSQHATQFLSRIRVNEIKTKIDLRNLLYIFHNIVNRRKQKPLFNVSELSTKYGNNKIIDVYNNFISVYKTKGNMRLLADSFQRNLIVNDFRKWIIINLRSFI